MTIATIALVAVVMGMSAVAPMIPMAEADKGDTGAPDKCRILAEKLTAAGIDPDRIRAILERAGCTSGGPEV